MDKEKNKKGYARLFSVKPNFYNCLRNDRCGSNLNNYFDFVKKFERKIT